MDTLKVALLGCGVVGTQVAKQLLDNQAEFAQRTGRVIELVGIGIRELKPRADIPMTLFTKDLAALVARPDLDIVIELMGGVEPAKSLISTAIANGAAVITANKALLAQYGPELYAQANAAKVDLYYEAAVAGAIPIIRPLRESLVGDQIMTVMGIVNGTTNFILDKMHLEGCDFDEALAQAQALGYAEADPTADIAGHDAAAKAAILASLAFHTQVRLSDVDCEGITEVSAKDIQAAKELNCVIKLLAHCQNLEDHKIAVSVHPTMVPNTHPLAAVSGAYNAVFVESAHAGELMFMGPGAGGAPTSAAVLGDVLVAARNIVRGTADVQGSAYAQCEVVAPGAVASRFHLSMSVRDEPGVLAKVAECFAKYGVSLQAVRQDASKEVDGILVSEIGITTHVAKTQAVLDTIAELSQQEAVRTAVHLLRVEGI